MSKKIITADPWILHLCNALDLDPSRVSRLVIDAQAGMPIRVLVEMFGDSRILEVNMPDSTKTEIQIEWADRPKEQGQ